MNKEILQKAIDTYGDDSQMDMCIEEMSELTKALLKFRRLENKKSTVKSIDYAEYISEKIHTASNVAEEIADVKIMLVQMEMIFGCSEEVNNQIEFKIKRLKERLKNGGVN